MRIKPLGVEAPSRPVRELLQGDAASIEALKAAVLPPPLGVLVIHEQGTPRAVPWGGVSVPLRPRSGRCCGERIFRHGSARLQGLGWAGSASTPFLAAILTMALVSGCTGADAALADVKCNQTDSTATCCLKMNPGQYERCGVSPPPRSAERINAAVPKLPTRQEKERWRKDICTPAYGRCIDAGGGTIEGRVWDETQCKACYEACMRYGSWPKEANDKPCPGA